MIRCYLTLFIIAFSLFISCSREQLSNNKNSDSIDLELCSKTDWAMANAIMIRINNHRNTLGLSSITIDSTYATAYAVEHTLYMIAVDDVNHHNFYKRSAGLKAQGASSVAENVGYGFYSADAVVNAWLNSASHREVIEGDYSHSGLGILTSSDGRYFFTQLFYKS
ncbi:MAG: CAP domain-containing protein [Bacteroidota bacterium]